MTMNPSKQVSPDWLDEFSREHEILRSALDGLEEAQAALAAEPDNTMLRDGVIHRFEMSYDLAIRWLRNRIKREQPNANRLGNFRIILCSANAGLLDNPDTWMRYTRSREQKAVEYARDRDSHAKVIRDIPGFVLDLRKLLYPPQTSQSPTKKHEVIEHDRADTYVEEYVRSDGTLVKGHWRSGTQVRGHRRRNRHRN